MFHEQSNQVLKHEDVRM